MGTKKALLTYVGEKIDGRHGGKEGAMRILYGGEGGGAMIVSQWGMRNCGI